MHDRPRALRFFAAAIALCAGYVDAIGFVGFGGTFVSFMSGNSTRVGASAAPPFALAGVTLAVIAAFVAGVAAGQALGGTGDRQRRMRVLLFVAVLLAGAAASARVVDPVVALLLAAAAMGATNTVFSAAPLPVGLTYMTGTLVRLGESLGERARGRPAAPLSPYLLHWLALVLGAALGAWAFLRLQLDALWPAAAAMLGLALLARRAGSRTGPMSTP